MTENIAVLQDLPVLEPTDLLELEGADRCGTITHPCQFITCIITGT